MHDLLYRLARPALHLIDPEQAHRLAIAALKRGLLRANAEPDDPVLATQVWGLAFSNPIGLAAGFDKHAEVIDPMLGCGFGFVEAGTVDARAAARQSGQAAVPAGRRRGRHQPVRLQQRGSCGLCAAPRRAPQSLARAGNRRRECRQEPRHGGRRRRLREGRRRGRALRRLHRRERLVSQHARTARPAGARADRGSAATRARRPCARCARAAASAAAARQGRARPRRRSVAGHCRRGACDRASTGSSSATPRLRVRRR